jgi:hypothetical protein
MTASVIFVIYIRQPELLIEPRFWAEEGTNYFSYAFSHSWLNNLFSPQYGYNTLYNSIATSFATMVPLDYAPSVTTYLAFTVQLLVSAAVIWWDIPVLNSLFKKFAMALFIQILAYSRLWVTTIGVQYWLCILSFLILMHNHNSDNTKVHGLHKALLILNGLTGILSCLLLPAFALKAVKTKSRRLMQHVIILSVCLLTQTAVFSYAYINNDDGLIRRFTHCDLSYMLSKLIKFQFSVPFFGLNIDTYPSAMSIETVIRQALSTIVGPSVYTCRYVLLEIGMGLFILCFISILISKKFNSIDTQLIMISVVLLTVISTYFSINKSGGPRYTFAPSVMIMFLVVGAINDKTIPRFLSYSASLLVTLSLTVSLMQYKDTMLSFTYDPAWPKWKQELSIWRVNHEYPIKIWPPPWQMTLTPK